MRREIGLQNGFIIILKTEAEIRPFQSNGVANPRFLAHAMGRKGLRESPVHITAGGTGTDGGFGCVKPVHHRIVDLQQARRRLPDNGRARQRAGITMHKRADLEVRLVAIAVRRIGPFQMRRLGHARPGRHRDGLNRATTAFGSSGDQVMGNPCCDIALAHALGNRVDSVGQRLIHDGGGLAHIGEFGRRLLDARLRHHAAAVEQLTITQDANQSLMIGKREVRRGKLDADAPAAGNLGDPLADHIPR